MNPSQRLSINQFNQSNLYGQAWTLTGLYYTFCTYPILSTSDALPFTRPKKNEYEIAIIAAQAPSPKSTLITKVASYQISPPAQTAKPPPTFEMMAGSERSGNSGNSAISGRSDRSSFGNSVLLIDNLNTSLSECPRSYGLHSRP